MVEQWGDASLSYVPGGAIKRDPERENRAVLTIAAQTANSIHIRVTFNVVTRYEAGLKGKPQIW